MKVTKIESCQSWKWFLYFLLKINSFDELKVAKFESYQLWKLPILKVAKVESCQNWEWFSISFWKLLSYQVAKLPICQITKLPNCQVAKLPSCQIAKLLNCQIAKWPSGQIAKLQVAKLWTCDHGAKSLSFLFLLLSETNSSIMFQICFWANSSRDLVFKISKIIQNFDYM